MVGSSPGYLHLKRELFDLRHVQLERRHGIAAGGCQYGPRFCQQLLLLGGGQLKKLLQHVHVLDGGE